MGVDLSAATPLPQPRCLAASASDGLPQGKDHPAGFGTVDGSFFRPEARLNFTPRKALANRFRDHRAAMFRRSNSAETDLLDWSIAKPSKSASIRGIVSDFQRLAP
ncbi:hypothetical protein [Novosphingobium sp.]|uniref:hypothetical protein n=1 Tax=Novosphingobium sp. TaxID=1874826 RepID=UPI0025CF1F0C|nr:hypothetical protein [Novosphingobium sp.]